MSLPQNNYSFASANFESRDDFDVTKFNAEFTEIQSHINGIRDCFNSDRVSIEKAIKDGAGNNIQSTYAASLDVSGGNLQLKNQLGDVISNPAIPCEQFTYVVDSDQKLADWANNVAGNDYTSVLIKKGNHTITLPNRDKGINLDDTGTKVIVGETDSKIIIDGASFKNGGAFFYRSNNTYSTDFYMFNVYAEADFGDVYNVYLFGNCLNLYYCKGDVKQSHNCTVFTYCRNLYRCTVVNAIGSSQAFGIYKCYSVNHCSVLNCSIPSYCYYKSYSSTEDDENCKCDNTFLGGYNTSFNDSNNKLVSETFTTAIGLSPTDDKIGKVVKCVRNNSNPAVLSYGDYCPIGTIVAYMGYYGWTSQYYADSNSTNSSYRKSLYSQAQGSALCFLPNRWLLCNGASLSQTGYADLFNVIGLCFTNTNSTGTTFNLPNLVGCHLVGAGSYADGKIRYYRTGLYTTTSSYPTSVSETTADSFNMGQFKDDALQGHEHLYNDPLKGTALGNRGVGGNDGTPNYKTLGITSDSSHGTPRTASVTRSKSIGVYYLIKY